MFLGNIKSGHCACYHRETGPTQILPPEITDRQGDAMLWDCPGRGPAGRTPLSPAAWIPRRRAPADRRLERRPAQRRGEYELADNPRQLTYSGQPTFIPCMLSAFQEQARQRFPKLLGVPLLDERAGSSAISPFTPQGAHPGDYAERSCGCAFRGG